MRQSSDSHETVMRQSWDSHETIMGQSWHSHDTVMRQSWESILLYFSCRPCRRLQTCNRVATWPWPSAYGEGHGKKTISVSTLTILLSKWVQKVTVSMYVNTLWNLRMVPWFKCWHTCTACQLAYHPTGGEPSCLDHQGENISPSSCSPAGEEGTHMLRCGPDCFIPCEGGVAVSAEDTESFEGYNKYGNFFTKYDC